MNNLKALIKKIRPYLELLWLVAIFIAVIQYLVSNWSDVSQEINNIPLLYLFASVAMVMIGRLGLVELARYATKTYQAPIKRDAMFYMLSISQLGKYLPGSVWQFIGRGAYYRQYKMDVGNITKAMALEMIWLLSAALLFGLALLAPEYIDGAGGYVVSITLILVWLGSLVAIDRIYLRQRSEMNLLGQIFGAQLWFWVISSLSFYLVIAELVEFNEILIILGIFTLSWLIGFFAIFAPSGIGIREGALIFFLSGTIDTELLVIYATIHRVLWTLGDLLMGIIARAFLNGSTPILVEGEISGQEKKAIISE